MTILSAGKPQRILLSTEALVGEDDELLKVMYPGDQASEVGSCYLLGASKIPQVLRSAEEGFERFRKTTSKQRSQILYTLAELIDAHAEDLAKLITLEAGKPIKLSRAEVARSIALCRGYAEQVNYLKAETYYMDGYTGTLRYFPMGPVFAITPFNFPLNLVLHKLAPAIAAGNSFTLKPASKTPLTAFYLAQLVQEAGYDALNVVPCRPAVAEQLLQSTVFRKFSFTGSAAVGWHLAGITKQKPMTLELGGNAACVIEDFDEAEVETIARRVAEGAFWYAGQICISVQRLYINQTVYEPFIKAFLAATRLMVVGNPLDPDTDVGPMIAVEEVFRTRNAIKQAIKDGANVLYGGNTYNAYTMNPSVFNRINRDMGIHAEEIFAPVVTVNTYTSFHEALAEVNHSQYGLQAGVYTRSLVQAEQAYEALDVGGVVINEVPTLRIDGLPYGGVKASGLGREGIIGGIQGMSSLKTMVRVS